MKLTYIWNKLIKKLPLSAVRDSVFESPSKVEARSTVIGTKMGRYSYCGYNCTLINCTIGRFCSIADNVTVGLANHPMEWVSTSPAFYRGKDSIPKDLATLDYDPSSSKTKIGNDVWIGDNVMIKAGVTVGDGAVIGMGSIVTKDVPAYAVVAGVPARVVKMRFPEEMTERLLKSRWWDLDPAVLKEHSNLISDPEAFLNTLEAMK